MLARIRREKQQPLAYYLYDWEDGIKLSVQPKCNNIHYYANVRTGARGYMGSENLARIFVICRQPTGEA